MSTFDVCILAPAHAEDKCVLCNVKAASEITVVHNALKLAAVTPGKRVLLNMDDFNLVSVCCADQDPRKECRCLAAGLSPTEGPFRYIRASLRSHAPSSWLQ